MSLNLKCLFSGFIFSIVLITSNISCSQVSSRGSKGTIVEKTQPFKVFQNITIIPMDGSSRILENQTVLIENDKIVAIGKGGHIPLPNNTKIIDGTNNFLLPGLVDAHIHLRHTDSTGLISYLKTGITTAREMNGRPFLLNWRERIKEGKLIGPNLYVACPTIGNFSSPKEGYPTPTTKVEVDSIIKRFVDEGYDWIKVYTFLPNEMFNHIIEAAAKYGIPVGGHPPIGVSFEDGLKMKSIEHLLGYLDPIMTKEAVRLDEEDMRGVFHAVEYKEEKLPDLARKTKLAGVWNCPTILFFDHNVPIERMRKVWNQPQLRELGHNNRVAIVKALYEAGANLVVGTDSDAGDDLPADAIHEEFENMIEAGMTPYDVINAATNNAAKFLNGESEFGSISVGKRADLLMVSCNPLKDISCLKNPMIVMSRGNIISFE